MFGYLWRYIKEGVMYFIANLSVADHKSQFHVYSHTFNRLTLYIYVNIYLRFLN